MGSADLARWSNPMPNALARNRLLELLPPIIECLELYFSSQAAEHRAKPSLLHIEDDLQLAAVYLADLGLRVDGDWLREKYYKVIVEWGFSLEESEAYASSLKNGRIGTRDMPIGFSRQEED